MKKLYPIAVEADVKQAIGSLGHAGESYNKVLRRLLNLEEKKREPLSDMIGHQSQTETAIATDSGGND